MTRLITSDEINQAWVRIDADWPRGRFQDLYRLVKDTLHDCAVLAEAHESAARQRAKSALPMVADIYADLRSGRAFGIPQDDGAAPVGGEPERQNLASDVGGEPDEPARLREGGAL